MNTDKLQAGYEVEWCHDLPRESDGSVDIDRAKYTRRDFETRQEAINYAKSVLPRSEYGSVQITKFHLEPDKYAHPPFAREYDGQSEFVE